MNNKFNRGTDVGKNLLIRSLKELGCGRSCLVDKNGVIIAGNQVYETATSLGKKIVTIETDGDVLVVVKRIDVDAQDTKGLELAFVDNHIAERNLNWDADTLLNTMRQKFSFDPRKWGGHSALVKELDLKDFLKEDVPQVEKKKEVTPYIDMNPSLFD